MSDFLIYSGYLILLINLIFYSFSFFRKKKVNVFFLWYLVFSCTMQYSMEIMYYLHKSNLFLANIFIIGQLILLGLFYNSLFTLKSQKKFVGISLCVALLVLAIQLIMDWSQFLRFNLFAIALTSLLIVVYALIHFYNMLTESKKYYYTSFGVVFYLLASTVLYFIGNLTHNLSNEIKFLSWQVNAFLIIIYYFFFLFEWKKSFSK